MMKLSDYGLIACKRFIKLKNIKILRGKIIKILNKFIQKNFKYYHKYLQEIKKHKK